MSFCLQSFDKEIVVVLSQHIEKFCETIVSFEIFIYLMDFPQKVILLLCSTLRSTF